MRRRDNRNILGRTDKEAELKFGTYINRVYIAVSGGGGKG